MFKDEAARFGLEEALEDFAKAERRAKG